MRIFPFILLAAIPYTVISAQTDSTIKNPDDVIDDILQEPNEETDNSTLYEIFEDLIKNPVNLNTAGISDLQRIPYLDLFSANAIIQFRKKYGHFFSVNELYSIKDLSKELIEKVIPFFSVSEKEEKKAPVQEEKASPKKFSLDVRSRALEDLQDRKGFIGKKFEGSKYKIYNRFLASYNDKFEIGFLTDKDAGEKSINEFTSFHVSIKNIGFIKNFIGGDYLVKFGQGLTLWSPYGFSKGADAIYPVKKRAKNIYEYKSSGENNFFRGGALNLELNNFSLTGFYSQNKLDANIDSVTGKILSTPLSGLHRTASEIEKRKTIEEKVIGGNINFLLENILNAGLLYYHSSFSNSFFPGSIYDLKGNNFEFYAFSYNLYLDRFNFFGEFSYDKTSVASLNGMEISLSKNFSFITSIRSYPKNFNSLHGFGFGEGSSVQNEFGIYNGIKWRTSIGIINFYFDQFKFPYATFDNPVPSEGNEFLVDLRSKPVGKVETKFRYKNERKEVSSDLSGAKILVNRLKQNFRMEIVYSISKSLRLKGRFEYNKFLIKGLKLNEEGYLMFQDLRFRIPKKLDFYFRISFFKTESFNSAIYEYENDLTGILASHAMYGEGVRWYFIIKYNLMKALTLSCKYSETFKPVEKSLSSGDSEIPGNLDNRLSLQIDFNL